MPEGFPKMTAAASRGRAVRQQTVAGSIPCRGIGLHGGRQVTMTLRPAPADTGVVFHRVDIARAGGLDPAVPARWERVVDTTLCTVVANDDDVRVGTIEHLMAALAGCGVDNLLVEVDAPELPIMDGSSEPFVFLLESVGLAEQDAPRRAIEILAPVVSGDAARGVAFGPGPVPAIDFEIDFASSVVSRERLRVELADGIFRREIARARTFGFLAEVEKLRAMGLARGGSLDNAIVIDGDRVLNEGGLRYVDEFVRHKILDCLGDLYLAGAPIIGEVRAVRSGHGANNQALRDLFAAPASFRIVEMTEDMLGGSVEDPRSHLGLLRASA